MSQAVVTQVVTKGAFRAGLLREDMAAQAEICFSWGQQAVGRLHYRQTMSTEQTGKGQLRHPLGQRHDRSQSQTRRTADKDINR